jgi:nucleoid-associated protein YgaU
MKRNYILPIIISLIPLVALIAIVAVRCYAADTPAPPLEISAIPTDTPSPAPSTSTPSPTATATAVDTPPSTATGTAVTPRATGTAVPSPTSTPSPTPANPPAATLTPASHTVQANEHLSGISEQYCGVQNWRWIYVENEERIKNPDIIFSGQVLVLPWPCEGE